MKKKWFLIPLGLIVFIIVALWGGDKYLYSLAYNQFLEIAVEKTGCEGDACDKQITDVIQALQQKRQLSENQVMRCLGANIIEEKDFFVVNRIKNQVVEWIYKTCDSDEVTLDDANIEIYDGPSSHGE